ncbi:ATPase P, partial [Streptomyces sp. NPDC005568]
PLPLGVAGHEGSTVLVGLNGLRLLRSSAWRSSAAG